MFMDVLLWLAPTVSLGLAVLLCWVLGLLSGYTKIQKKHIAFRMAMIWIAIEGGFLIFTFGRNVTNIRFFNGELPLEMVIGLGFVALIFAAMEIAGRLIFGEAGRLNPKRQKAENSNIEQ